MLESIVKIVLRISLLVAGWAIGALIFKIVSAGKAKSGWSRSADEEGRVSAFAVFERGEDGELYFSDYAAAWTGVLVLLAAIWACKGFPVPW